MAEDGRRRGDVRPARQATRRPPPVLPRSTRDGSRSVLVSLVSGEWGRFPSKVGLYSLIRCCIIVYYRELSAELLKS